MTKLKIYPLGEWVLVEPEEQPKMIGHIHLPETAQKKSDTGTILKLGPKAEKGELELKEGQKILFKEFAGFEIEREDKKYKMLLQKDILATL